MTKQEKIRLIKDLIKHYQELNSNFDSIYKLFGSADSKFTDSVWNAFEAYMRLVQKTVGDKLDWISWFIYDNQCGKANMVYPVNGNKTKVKTVGKLVELIEEVE